MRVDMGVLIVSSQPSRSRHGADEADTLDLLDQRGALQVSSFAASFLLPFAFRRP